MDEKRKLMAITSVRGKIKDLCSLLGYDELYTSEKDWGYNVTVKILRNKESKLEGHTVVALKVVDNDVICIDDDNEEFNINLLVLDKDFVNIDYMLKQRINKLIAPDDGGSEI